MLIALKVGFNLLKSGVIGHGPTATWGGKDFINYASTKEREFP